MPRLPVGFHPAALDDSVAAEAWYRQRSEAAAVAFVAELDQAVERIGEAPERWPRHTHRNFAVRVPRLAVAHHAPSKQAGDPTLAGLIEGDLERQRKESPGLQVVAVGSAGLLSHRVHPPRLTPGVTIDAKETS